MKKYIDAGHHPDDARSKDRVSSPMISTTVGVGIRTQFRICASQCACHFFESRVHGPACVGWGHAWSCVCVCVCVGGRCECGLSLGFRCVGVRMRMSQWPHNSRVQSHDMLSRCGVRSFALYAG